MKCSNLEEVRKQIDRIDEQIIALLGERTDYVLQAARFKNNEQGVQDTKRVEAVIEKVRSKAMHMGADPDLIETLYRSIIQAFIDKEMKEFHNRSAAI